LDEANKAIPAFRRLVAEVFIGRVEEEEEKAEKENN